MAQGAFKILSKPKSWVRIAKRIILKPSPVPPPTFLAITLFV